MRVYEVMDAEKANFEVTRMARLSDVSRSGYYAWKARDGQLGPRARRRAELAGKIHQFHDQSDGVNGSPRILADLREDGEKVSRKTVAKIMRHEGIVGISPATWHPVTTITEGAHTIPDLVERNFDQGRLDVVWTSDITYLKTGEGWLYLCAVRDGCSRKVLGWSIADHMRTDMVEAAVRSAVTMRGYDVSGVILHVDRGSQYTSDQLSRTAQELGLRLSVGRTGVCWDNSQIESFWSTLKTEFYNRYHFATKAEAKRAVGAWVAWYNQDRLMHRLGRIPPLEAEAAYYDHKSNHKPVEALT